MKKALLILGFLGFIFNSTAQNSLILEKKDASKKDILIENERIKVKTTDGNWYIGTFTIVDEKTISIDNQPILLENIVKIRQQPKTAATFADGLKGAGTLATVSGLAVAAGGNFGLTAVLVPSGLLLRGAGLLIDGSNHKPKKWNYSIVMNPKP